MLAFQFPGVQKRWSSVDWSKFSSLTRRQPRSSEVMTPPAVFQRVVAVFEKTTRSTRSRRLQPRPEAGLGKLTLTRCLRVRRFTRAPYSFQPPSCTGRSRARLPSIAMTTRAPPRHSRVRAHTDTARAPKRAGLKLIDPLRPRTTARPPEAVRSLYASA